MKEQIINAKMAVAFRKFKDAYIQLNETWSEYDREVGHLTFTHGFPFAESFDELHISEWCNHYIRALEAGEEVEAGAQEDAEDHGRDIYNPIDPNEKYMVYDKPAMIDMGEYNVEELLDHYDEEEGWTDQTVDEWVRGIEAGEHTDDFPEVGDVWESATLRITRIK